jgi:hypothetical protein
MTYFEGFPIDAEPGVEGDDGFDVIDSFVQIVISVDLFFEHLGTKSK